MPLILNTPALERSLHDFYLCSSRLDSDFFLYAYRAVEDIRLFFGSDDDPKKIWPIMNAALGRKESDYTELVQMSKDSRHSNLLAESVDKAIAKRNFDFVRLLIKSFIEYLLSSQSASAAPKTPEAKSASVRRSCYDEANVS